MPFSSNSEIKKLLEKYRLSPSKRLGQNFLIDKGVVRKIITAADLHPSDVVLEIGPGPGTLTLELAKRVKKVIAIEKDPRMTRLLNDELRINDIKNARVIEGDVLKISNFQFPISKQIQNSKFQAPKRYKVVANLPFYLTAPVIRKFLESPTRPKMMVLVVQKEVAQRICAKPPKMNLLAVSVQFYAQPKIISYLPSKSFWPQPKVDSAIIRIDPQINTDKKTDSRRFFQVVKAGFSQPRKQLVNNLSKKLKLNKEGVKSWLLKNGIQPTQRAEALTIENWINLTEMLKHKNEL